LLAVANLSLQFAFRHCYSMARSLLTDPPPRPPIPASALPWRRAFRGCAQELAHVRQWLSCLLAACPARADVLSVAVELCSNALEHTRSGQPGGSFAVEVTWGQSLVQVAVSDGGSPGEPRLIDPDPDAEHGRGLRLVRGLSERTGWTGDEQGRVVWAQIACPVDTCSVRSDSASVVVGVSS
jgi:anti-sigma regulatory factor (Ser/Thr protein kinase)